MKQRRSFGEAVGWAYTWSWGERGFSAVFTFLLAGILGPRAFGSVAIASTYVTFLQMFLDQGFATALIQRKDLTDEHLDSVFWLDMALSFVLVAASVALSRWWAGLNHVPQIAFVIVALSLCVPIEGLTIVQRALLQRQMDFRSLCLRGNVSVITSGIVGCVMAWRGYGVWSLVGLQLTRDVTALAMLWKMSHWRPRARFSFAALKDLGRFASSNFVGQLGTFADRESGGILLGTFFGPVAVGLYRFAERLANTVLTVATSSVQAVSLPEFSRLQDDAAALRQSVLKCLRFSATITIPALAGLAWTSTTVMAATGDKWIPAANVLRVLSLLGIILVFHYFTGPLLQATGRPHIAAVLEWARVIVGVAILVVAAIMSRHGSDQQQIMSIAGARFLNGALIFTPIYLFVLMRTCGVTIRELLTSIRGALAGSGAMIAALALLFSTGVGGSLKPILWLALQAAVGGGVGIAAMLIVDRSLRNQLNFITRRFVSPLAVESQ